MTFFTFLNSAIAHLSAAAGSFLFHVYRQTAGQKSYSVTQELTLRCHQARQLQFTNLQTLAYIIC